jgi:hypothetical protein
MYLQLARELSRGTHTVEHRWCFWSCTPIKHPIHVREAENDHAHTRIHAQRDGQGFLQLAQNWRAKTAPRDPGDL